MSEPQRTPGHRRPGRADQPPITTASDQPRERGRHRAPAPARPRRLVELVRAPAGVRRSG